MIPQGCPSLNQPCGHPELTQSGPAMLDFFRGVGIVVGVCVIAWALWWLYQQGRLMVLRRREEHLHEVHRRPPRD
jgi:hypothetical protein